MRRPRLFGWGVAVTVGMLCGLTAQSNWETVQLFLHRGSFGIVDPEFGHDIGFFVFDLPLYTVRPELAVRRRVPRPPGERGDALPVRRPTRDDT